jgi:hypothetical protein
MKIRMRRLFAPCGGRSRIRPPDLVCERKFTALPAKIEPLCMDSPAMMSGGMQSGFIDGLKDQESRVLKSS